MEDREIVALYWLRDETALAETEKKYGGYCHAIAYRILESSVDAEECVGPPCFPRFSERSPGGSRSKGCGKELRRSEAAEKHR